MTLCITYLMLGKLSSVRDAVSNAYIFMHFADDRDPETCSYHLDKNLCMQRLKISEIVATIISNFMFATTFKLKWLKYYIIRHMLSGRKGFTTVHRSWLVWLEEKGKNNLVVYYFLFFPSFPLLLSPKVNPCNWTSEIGIVGKEPTNRWSCRKCERGKRILCLMLCYCIGIYTLRVLRRELATATRQSKKT